MFLNKKIYVFQHMRDDVNANFSVFRLHNGELRGSDMSLVLLRQRNLGGYEGLGA